MCTPSQRKLRLITFFCSTVFGILSIIYENNIEIKIFSYIHERKIDKYNVVLTFNMNKHLTVKDYTLLLILG